ncbi:MAG: SEL1-like repeat protein [Gammaproteobacteria bacterium]
MTLSIIMLLLAGCWAMTIPAPAPDAYHEMNSSDSLIGTSIYDVIQKLGYPDKVRERSGRKYLIYKDYGGGVDVGFLLYAPFAVLPSDSGKGSIHCLLLAIDQDYLITDVQLKTRGVGPEEFFTGSAQLPESCARIFWEEHELSSFHDSTEETLSILKEHMKAIVMEDISATDLSSAIKLLERFDDAAALEYLLTEGNEETIDQFQEFVTDRKNVNTYFKLRQHNTKLANKILCGAIERKYCQAYILLGATYYSGDGVPRDLKKAYAWYRYAERMKCPDCCSTTIKQIREWLSPEELLNAELLSSKTNPEQCAIELGVTK